MMIENFWRKKEKPYGGYGGLGGGAGGGGLVDVLPCVRYVAVHQALLRRRQRMRWQSGATSAAKNKR